MPREKMKITKVSFNSTHQTKLDETTVKWG